MSDNVPQILGAVAPIKENGGGREGGRRADLILFIEVPKLASPSLQIRIS